MLPHLNHHGNRQSAGTTRRASAPAFTLVELVVVVAVILILLAVVLPATSALWNERKSAEAENLLQGVMRTARAHAVSTGGEETGLFFFLDGSGTQRVASIEKARPPLGAGVSTELAHQDAFRFSSDRDELLPAPMRVVPRYAIVKDDRAEVQPSVFSDIELANQNYEPPIGANIQTGQRHRNFFAMVLGPDAQPIVGRNVFIQDPSSDVIGQDGLGDRTGLTVGNAPNDFATAQYYVANSSGGARTYLDPTGGRATVEFLIGGGGAGGSRTAINFPSVDGVLLYDDQLYSGFPLTEKRDFLRRNAQPFYVSRVSGEVIRGPLGDGI